MPEILWRLHPFIHPHRWVFWKVEIAMNSSSHVQFWERHQDLYWWSVTESSSIQCGLSYPESQNLLEQILVQLAKVRREKGGIIRNVSGGWRGVNFCTWANFEPVGQVRRKAGEGLTRLCVSRMGARGVLAFLSSLQPGWQAHNLLQCKMLRPSSLRLHSAYAHLSHA